MSELNANAQFVLKGFQAFGEGDTATMKGLFTDDSVWHVGGHSRWAGDYHGADAIVRFFGEISAEATIDQDLHAVLADDEHVVALVNSTATRGDRTLDSQSVFIFHISEGKATEVWTTSLDDRANDEFWG